MKRFLDGLGYYLLYGDVEGIITEYQQVVGQAREIPVSSCPSNVANMLYAGGNVSGDVSIEEQLGFQTMAQLLDERAAIRHKTRPTAQKHVSRRSRMR